MRIVIIANDGGNVATRNIYVSKADEKLWEKAEEIAEEIERGSLSSLVTRALRDYIEEKKGLEDRIEEEVWIKAKILEWGI